MSHQMGKAKSVEMQKEKVQTIYELEQEMHQLKLKLKGFSRSLKEHGATHNGFESAYYLDPPPNEFPTATIHSRYFRKIFCKETSKKTRSQRMRLLVPEDMLEIPFEWQIEPLGRHKCQILFEKFDEDQDGKWNYQEFLEYLGAIDLYFHQPPLQGFFAIDTIETWRLCMNDLYDTDPIDGNLTLKGFIMLREAMESDFPLAKDLQRLGICLEWPELEHHRRMSFLFDQYIQNQEEQAVPLHLIQFLCAECGLYAPQRYIHEALKTQRYHFRSLGLIRQQKRTIKLFGYKQKSNVRYTNIKLEEEPYICKPAFLSLILSQFNTTTTTQSITPWRLFALKCRLKSFVYLHRLQIAIENAFYWIREASKSGLLKEKYLKASKKKEDSNSKDSLPPSEELGDYVLKAEIGKPNFQSHASIQIQYNPEADSGGTLHQLKYLEPGAESFVYFDIQTRAGLKESELQLIAEKISYLLTEYFSEHLEALPFFHRWFVTIPTKNQLAGSMRSGGGGGSRGGSRGCTVPISSASTGISIGVIRLVILFNGQMDLFEVLQSLNLPRSMQMDHYLQRFSIRLLLSHSLDELIINRHFILGKDLSLRIFFDSQLNRKAIGQIITQALEKRRDLFRLKKQVQEFAQKQKQEALEQEAQRRNRSSMGTKKNTSSSSKAHMEMERNQQVHGIKSSSSQPRTTTNRYTPPDDLPALKEPEDPWEETMNQIDQIANWIQFSKSVSFNWRFRNVTQIFLGNRYMESIFSIKKLQQIKNWLITPGAFASAWKTWSEEFKSEMGFNFLKSSTVGLRSSSNTTANSTGKDTVSFTCNNISRSSLHSDLDIEATEVEEIRVSSASSSTSSTNFSSTTSTAVSSINATTAGTRAASGTASSTTTPDYSSKMKRVPSTKDMATSSEKQKDDLLETELLEIYDVLVNNLAGLHYIRAEAGTSGLSMTFDGFNIVPFLPQLKLTPMKKSDLIKIRSIVPPNSAVTVPFFPGVSPSPTPNHPEKMSL